MTDQEFVLAATGDAIVTQELLAREGSDDRFDGLLAVLRDAHATATNLEVPLPDERRSPAEHGGLLHLRAEPRVLDELTGIGCTLFGVANNHAYDYGPDGVRDTIAALEARDLAFAGAGRTLRAARRPAYHGTPAGRVALVSASTSLPPESAAGPASPSVPGRPGVNPLRVDPIYRLPEPRLDELRAISEAAGIEARKRAWRERGIAVGHDWDDGSYFHFDGMKFEGVADEDEAGVRYDLDDRDRRAVLSWVAEAAVTADWVVVSLHAHQGPGGERNVEGTPAFLVEFSQDCIDAGADAVVTTGPHVIRGMEVYEGKPVFYSLGNFLLQLETVDRFPADTYRRFGVPDADRPSALFDEWFYDDGGALRDGLIGGGPVWETVVPTCRFDADGTLARVELAPCWLQETRGPPVRGTPVLASGERARSILERFADRSRPFGTTVVRRDGRGFVEP